MKIWCRWTLTQRVMARLWILRNGPRHRPYRATRRSNAITRAARGLASVHQTKGMPSIKLGRDAHINLNRKHEARHKKLFKCDEPNCTRTEGFGTINDLARHKKCVHKKDPERGPKVLYMCFGQNCPRSNKKWPRLDNFRQHLARMHNNEDINELLRRYAGSQLETEQLESDTLLQVARMV